VTEAVEREGYEDMGRWLERKEIVALIGVRRGGKTTLLKMLVSRLLKRADPKNVLFVKCDDDRVEMKGMIDDAITTYRKLFNPSGKIFLFLDEVQEIPGWGKTIKRIYDLDSSIKIFLAGSSSAVLKAELSTVLAGRVAYFTVYPFSFREFMNAKGARLEKANLLAKKNEVLHYMKEYMEFGGFPEVVLEKSSRIKSELLGYYYDSILFRDIARRYHIRNMASFERLVVFLLTNMSNPVNFNRTAKSLGLSVDSVTEYVRCLQETFLAFAVPVLSYSVKAQQMNPKKIYCVDTGLRNFTGFRFSEDAGRLAENMVFTELRRRGGEIYYWKNGGEVDFVVKKQNRVSEIIQVCWDVKNKETVEVSSLVKAAGHFKLKSGMILTEDFEGVKKIDDIEITFKPIWKWLLFQ
jgi:hypothetical protein